MRKLTKPSLTVSDIREACEKSIQDDEALRNRLSAVAGHLGKAEAEYEKHSSTKTWYQIKELKKKKKIGGTASKDDMKEAYARLRDKKSCRPLYNRIRNAVEFDDCPFCGEREVKTLDHYLAKSKHPALAITPSNLVPSCNTCNNSKNASAATTPSEQLLHPYYDDVESEQWLFAEVLKAKPASFRFKLKLPKHFDPTIKLRISGHFKSLSLNELYVKRSGRLLGGIRGYLNKNLYKQGGMRAVRKYMLELAESHFEDCKNDWRTAFYQACAENDWFCDGGFKQK